MLSCQKSLQEYLGMGLMKSLSYAGEKFTRTITVEKTPGRNDRCPCGSGKKYKKCCGKIS